MSNQDIVIVAAKRTAIGAFLGGFANTPATVLGETLTRAILAETGVASDTIEQVVLGQVLTAGCGQNPARQVALNAGLSQATPAFTLNMVCGSGLLSVIQAAQSIATDNAECVLVGGQESMSLAPHVHLARQAVKYGDASLIDTIVSDGLKDAFDGEMMGITAERLAEKYDISREAQDAFSLRSQEKAKVAMENDSFANEIVPVEIKQRKSTVTINTDEHVRADTTLESLGKLRPAFKPDGTVTAGNASGINDGAAQLLLMTAEKAKSLGLTPLVKLVSYATAGVAPALMGYGPVPASEKALARAGWTVGDLDLIEANEAFAAQAIAVNQGLGWDTDKVNVTGGAIALGHPIGASGARILVTLIHNLIRLDKQKGIATLCVGGGQGVAVCVER